jgi:hypothetical protein
MECLVAGRYGIFGAEYGTEPTAQFKAIEVRNFHCTLRLNVHILISLLPRTESGGVLCCDESGH